MSLVKDSENVIDKKLVLGISEEQVTEAQIIY